MRPDDHVLWHDELAERRRERDREREPRRFRRTATDLHARQVELMSAAAETSITAIECPACLGPVFAPVDSHCERIDCLHCDARLITQRAIGGELTALLVPDGAP